MPGRRNTYNSTDSKRFVENLLAPYLKGEKQKVKSKLKTEWEKRKFLEQTLAKWTAPGTKILSAGGSGGLISKIVGTDTIKVAPMKFGFDKDTMTGLEIFAASIGGGIALNGLFKYLSTKK